MLASYKLRLSDGTVLEVDHDGLSTWLVDDEAMVQLVGSTQWRPLKAFLAGERASTKEGADAAWSAEARDRLEEVLPQETPTPAEPRPSDPVEPFFLGDPPSAQNILADEPVGPRTESVSHRPTPNEHVAPIPSKAPVDDEVYVRPAASRWSESLETPSIGAKTGLLVLADDIRDPNGGNAIEAPSPDDGLPIIRLKPRDDRDEAQGAVRPTADEARPWHDSRDEKLFARVAAVGGFLSVWLSLLDRQLGRLSSSSLFSRWMDHFGRPRRRLPSIPPEGPAPSASRTSHAIDPSVRTLPKLQPLAEEPTDLRDGFTRPQATPDPVLPNEPLNPPPPINDLKVLRLADLDEPEVAGDLYEDDRLGRTAWLWTKRVVVITGVLAGGIFAALTWETWLPKAARLGRIVFAEIDKSARSRDQTERRQRALQAASEQLPHLDPDTIRLVLAGGVLDPPEVFRLACEAADRGFSALSPGEAQELTALRQQMLDTLRTEERQRAREYDRARGRRLTLPFEDSDVLELFARGARALPPASRARLQVLSGKVIAAGLLQDAPAGQRRPEGD
jgi:hypothetical protein